MCCAIFMRRASQPMRRAPEIHTVSLQTAPFLQHDFPLLNISSLNENEPFEHEKLLIYKRF